MVSNISLTTQNIDEIMAAFGQYFPEKESGVVYVSGDSEFVSKSGEYVWENRESFLDYVTRLTGIKIDPKKIDTKPEIEKVRAAQKAIAKLGEKPSTSPQEQPAATTPGKEQLEYLSQKAEKAKLKTAATQVKVAQQSQEQLQKLRKLAAENIYLKAQEIKIPESDQATINDFQARVTEAKKNPTAYVEKLTKIIAKEDNTDEATAKIIAVNLTDKLVSIEPTETLEVQLGILYSQNPIHALASLSNPNDPELIKLIPNEAERLEFCKAAQNLALVQGHDNILARNLLSKILPEQTVKLLYPEADNLLQFSISEKQEGSHHIVNRQGLIESYQRTSPFLDNLQSDAKSYALKFADKSLSNLPWYSKTKGLFGRANISIAGSSLTYESGMLAFFSSKGIPLLAPDLAGILASQQFSNIAVSSALNFRMGTFAFSRAILSEGGNMVGQALGVNLGNYAIRFTTIAGKEGLKLALNIGTKAAVEGATKLGAQAAISTTLATTLSATFGAFAPFVGHAIGAVVGWLVGKVGEALINFIKRHKDFFKYAGLAMLAAGGFLGLWPLAAFGGLMFLGALGLGGLAAAGTNLATAGVRTLGFFGSMAVSISTTAVIIMLSFPVVVALILFIINSGAYIVPPKLSTLASSPTSTIISPYIDVSKVASPAGPFKNSDLPLTIKYTITITAKKGALTHIGIAYDCKIIKEKSSPACPAITPGVPTGKDIPESISPAQSYSFEYTQVIKGSDFNDSLISDTITVTADATEQAGAKAAASLGIKIGNPPDTCPNGWPIDGTYTITQTPHGGFSHAVIEAMDIATGTGTPVKATHSGIAHVVYTSGAYRPVYVDISSNCGGAFSSRYAHLSAVSVRDGQVVNMGQVIGLSGSDGTGPHLHYEFLGLKMTPPNIPKSIPYGCSSSNCGQIP